MTSTTLVTITLSKDEWSSIALSVVQSSGRHAENGFFFTAAEERRSAAKIYSFIGDEVSANTWAGLAQDALVMGRMARDNAGKENEQ